VAVALQDRAETLIIVPRANSGPFEKMCIAYDVPYRAMPLTRITKEWRAALAYLTLSPLEVLRLARLFRRERIDLVHASGGSWQYKAVIAAWLAGVPSVWHLNDTSTPGWVRGLFRMVQPLAQGFIFASHLSQDYYGNLIRPGRPQAVVPSTVDTVQFDPNRRHLGDEAILEKLGSAPVIGTVANINRVKGLGVLIESFALARRTLPSLRLVIVGPVHDNQAAYYRTLCTLAEKLGVAEEIEWVGARVDVRPLMARADIYVCSSLAESSPVAVWEAMALERPVVSTNVGDVSRHVIDGQNGYVVSVGDVESLAARIVTLIEDPDARKRMGAAAREAAKYFAPPTIAEKTLALYYQVLDQSKV
jgi:glycosyltransferase involved in cell wall biosynthesis